MTLVTVPPPSALAILRDFDHEHVVAVAVEAVGNLLGHHLTRHERAAAIAATHRRKLERPVAHVGLEDKELHVTIAVVDCNLSSDMEHVAVRIAEERNLIRGVYPVVDAPFLNGRLNGLSWHVGLSQTLGACVLHRGEDRLSEDLLQCCTTSLRRLVDDLVDGVFHHDVVHEYGVAVRGLRVRHAISSSLALAHHTGE